MKVVVFKRYMAMVEAPCVLINVRKFNSKFNGVLFRGYVIKQIKRKND